MDTNVDHKEEGWYASPRLKKKGQKTIIMSVRRDRRFSDWRPSTDIICVSVIIIVCLMYATTAAFSQSRPQLETHTNQKRFQLDVLPPFGNLSAGLPLNFPDPSVIQGEDDLWYAFATNSGDVTVQVAVAEDPLGEWQLLNYDAMPTYTWTSGVNTWAPDVRELDDGSYIMYFTGEVPGSHKHCIGIARAGNVLGPYEPDPDPWVCPLSQGGAIDASGFYDDVVNKRYVVYKIDGNSKGGYTRCGTGAWDPNLQTPIMLQQVTSDGATKINQPIKLLDRYAPLDGALIEAPNLVHRSDGMYVLFFSSHCFTDPRYDVKYAYSWNVAGPYKRAGRALLSRGDWGLNGPGGMTSARLEGTDLLVFHGNCEEGRCLYSVVYDEE